MKNPSKTLLYLLLIIFSGSIVFAFVTSKKKQNTLSLEMKASSDSLGKLNFENYYLSQLLNTNNRENNRMYSFDNIQLYELKNSEHQNPCSLASVLKKGKNKIIFRLTEIGCNACTDSTISLIKKSDILKANYDILILVDFSNYDAYLKWKKIAEIAYPVLWVKKGDLPFDIELQESSYLFTVNNSLTVNDFFLPNSRFPTYIHNYISGLESKL